MAFVKPFTYVDGNVLNADDQRSNEEAAKVYVNQEIVAADIGTNLDYTEIEAGEFLPVTDDHKFASSFIAGQNLIVNRRTRAYFTSTSKHNTQTAASSIVYRDLYGAGKKIKLDASAEVIITFQAAFIAFDNSTTSGGDGRGKWENKILLKHIDYTRNSPTPTYIAGTRGYVFEGVGAAAGTLDPNAGGNAASRRQVQFQTRLTLTRGEHDLQMAVNPKIEAGYGSARNFLVEVFYL
jgi:hypothetical protein